MENNDMGSGVVMNSCGPCIWKAKRINHKVKNGLGYVTRPQKANYKKVIKELVNT